MTYMSLSLIVMWTAREGRTEGIIDRTTKEL